MKNLCSECDASMIDEVPVLICQNCFVDFHMLKAAQQCASKGNRKMEDNLLDEASVVIRHLIDEQGKRDVIAWAERWLKRYEVRPTQRAADGANVSALQRLRNG